jgi:type IV pilus assembly protein PilY1
VTLQWNNLHETQRAALNRDLDNIEDGLGSARLAWLRGTEHVAFRSRSESGSLRLLGDIIHSDPQFKNDVLYVGANDGMLHAFDAKTGEELFAYIPSPLLLPEPDRTHAPLSRLMDPNYIHRYFVDGKATLADVTLGGSTKTVLVGGMGAGGRTVFALDISDPQNFSASKVLWEFTHAELGYNVGQPAIARMSDGTWAAVFGNGYNSDSGKAALFVVNLATGALIQMIPTNNATGNGLASPFVTDWPKMNLRAQRIYAGDLLGNLWAFDVSSTNTSHWTHANNRRVLFAAQDPDGNPQPITSRPHGARLPSGEAMIVFGTGSYFRTQDGNDTQVQSLYGIIDHPTPANDPVVRPNDLLQQEIVAQTTFQDQTVRVLSDYTVNDDPEKTGGWFIDLKTETGERVISGPRTLGYAEQRVRFTTLIPDEDPCGVGRGGFLMDIDLLTGGRTSSAVFDLDGDGFFDEQDMIEITVNGEKVPVPVSGLGFGSGEAIAVIAVPDPAPVCVNGDCTTPDPYELICDGQGNCERGRPDDVPGGRQSWRQLR